jgi:hypothetical protein
MKHATKRRPLRYVTFFVIYIASADPVLRTSYAKHTEPFSQGAILHKKINNNISTTPPHPGHN